MREGDKIVRVGYKFLDEDGQYKYRTERVENTGAAYFRQVLNEFSDIDELVYIIKSMTATADTSKAITLLKSRRLWKSALN